MYSYNDFERLFLRYKLEGIPAGVSIEKFCMSNKVPYNLFFKWYKDTRKKFVFVLFLCVFFQMVQGYPEEDSPCSGFGCSLIGIRNAGKSFANFGTKARIGFSAFLSY